MSQPALRVDEQSELFELSLLGGAVERRYRRLRPEVEALPWGTLDRSRYAPELLAAARAVWTEAAFQEHRTGAACAATLKALICARAPLDLIAMATRFPLDELVHVELASRLAEELGGAVPLSHNPRQLVFEPDPELPVLLQAAELVVRNFCVGEALSVPLLRASWHAARHPLVKAVLGRIVKDEAAHGEFGWMFLDWAAEALTPEQCTQLAHQAALTVRGVTERWKAIVPRPGEENDAHRLGWMESSSYLAQARSALETHVLRPLGTYGIDVERALLELRSDASV